MLLQRLRLFLGQIEYNRLSIRFVWGRLSTVHYLHLLAIRWRWISKGSALLDLDNLRICVGFGRQTGLPPLFGVPAPSGCSRGRCKAARRCGVAGLWTALILGHIYETLQKCAIPEAIPRFVSYVDEFIEHPTRLSSFNI